MNTAEGVSVTLLDLDRIECSSGGPINSTTGDSATALGAAVQRRRSLALRREVRLLLAARLTCSPESVPIRRGRNGKLEVVGAPLHFAVAARGAECVVVLCGSHPVGVHLAPVRADPPVDALMLVLPGHVRFAVLNAAPEAQAREFALWWCRIQAAVKACGAGLDEATISLARTGQEARLLGPDVAVGVAGAALAGSAVRWDMLTPFRAAS